MIEMAGKILVVGSLNMDVLVNMQRLPAVGETVMGLEYDFVPGGKGANQACAASKAGGTVTMLGCIGDDKNGAVLKKVLQDAGVDASRLLVKSEARSGTAFVYYDKNGENSIVVIPGANHCCGPDYLRGCDDLIAACDCVLLQLEIPMETVIYTAKRAKELGKHVILNPAPVSDDFPSELYQYIDILTPNETELKTLTAVDGVTLDGYAAASKILLSKGVKTVIVTLGEKGALLVNNEMESLIDGRAVVPTDTTGAGDCFNGVLSVGIAKGRDLAETVRIANAAASISVTRTGAAPSMPSAQEIEAILKQ